MLLVADVGNSHTVLGVFDGARRVATARVGTAARTADELGLLLVGLLGARGVAPGSLRGAALCTVVPAQQRVFEEAVPAWLGCPLRVYGAEGRFGIPVVVDHPETLGPDRVVNTLAVAATRAPPFLVVDLGTATTFDAVDAAGRFVGGAIAPGLGIAAEALVGRTARLPPVPLRSPGPAIGTNTVAAIQSGLYWGYVGLVDGLATRIKAELGREAWCVATGGLAAVIAADCRAIDAVDPELTLNGLRIWYEST